MVSGVGTPALRIAVIGGAECTGEVESLAETVGRHVAEAGALLVCGGLGGVMEAAARGASAAGGIVIGLLPGYDATDANPWVQVPLPTGLGHARNVLVVAAADAIVALPGEAGTRSELAMARILGRPTVALGRAGRDPDADEHTGDAGEAVGRALALGRRGRSERAR
jgi:uncharacterized protein (TIGR00725 family)